MQCKARFFIAAYLLRYESDLIILAFVSAFFLLAITTLQVASRSGRRIIATDAPSAPLSTMLSVLQRPDLMPRFSYLAIALALTGYAAIVVVDTAEQSGDVRILVAVLLAFTVCLAFLFRAEQLKVVEKGVLYVTATVLVYFDASIVPADRYSSILTWAAISVVALATAVRLRLRNDRRFQVTPLDLIVLFMALVVPSLPGNLSLPQGGPWTIAKLLVLFYGIEVLASRSEGKALWLRAGMVCTLASLAARPLLAF